MHRTYGQWIKWYRKQSLAIHIRIWRSICHALMQNLYKTTYWTNLIVLNHGERALNERKMRDGLKIQLRLSYKLTRNWRSANEYLSSRVLKPLSSWRLQYGVLRVIRFMNLNLIEKNGSNRILNPSIKINICCNDIVNRESVYQKYERLTSSWTPFFWTVLEI